MKQMIYQSNRATEVLHSGKFKGVDFVILSLGTHPTAYVNVPKDNIYYGTDYDNVDVEVHGGLTYAAENVQLSNITGWWIGWDYAHSGDYVGYDMFPNEFNDRKYTTKQIMEDVKSVIEQLKNPGLLTNQGDSKND